MTKSKTDLRTSKYRKHEYSIPINFKLDTELEILLEEITNKLKLRPSTIARELLRAGIKNALNQTNTPFESICKNIKENTNKY